jgi:hypothetical protein
VRNHGAFFINKEKRDKMESDVKWVVENHVFDEDIDSLIKEIKKQGMSVKQVSYIPFENGTYDFYPSDSCVI